MHFITLTNLNFISVWAFKSRSGLILVMVFSKTKHNLENTGTNITWRMHFITLTNLNYNFVWALKKVAVAFLCFNEGDTLVLNVIFFVEYCHYHQPIDQEYMGCLQISGLKYIQTFHPE